VFRTQLFYSLSESFRSTISSLSTETLVEAFHTFLVVFLLGDPEFLLVAHDVGQIGTTQEDHVLSSGRIFDSELEFAALVSSFEQFGFSFQNTFDVEFLEVLFEARRSPGYMLLPPERTMC